MEPHNVAKATRYVRNWFWIAIRDIFSPLFDRNEILRFLMLPSFLLLLAIALDADDMAQEWTRLDLKLLALTMTMPIWIVFNIIAAAIKVPIEERKKGRWFGNRFVYHSPLKALTTLVSPEDDWTSTVFKVDDAEPEAFVQFKIEYEGGIAAARITPVGLLQDAQAWNMNTDQIQSMRDIKYGAKLNKRREAQLDVYCPKNSDATIMRIRVLSWQIE